MFEIKISTDFSDTPGGRYAKDGDYSGEDLREKILIPAYNKAKEQNEKICIDLDDCYGVPTSFLEETFGGFVRKMKSKEIKDMIIIKSEDRSDLKDKIFEYIENA